MIEVIPWWAKAALAALGALVLLLAGAGLVAAARGRRLERQRRRLVGEIGLLQSALLPSVPELDGLVASAAYRPAAGVAAGGDFYDVFRCRDGSVGVLIGDLSGHGRESVSRTALVRHTVRAYLEAGMEPRAALQLAGRVLDRSFGDEEFVTVLAARYRQEDGTLVYAAAGHPPPLVLSPGPRPPVTAASAPAIALGVPTGQRQTRLELPAGSAVLFYTDGLLDARSGGAALEEEGLARLFADYDHPAASSVLDRVVAGADHLPDDMAACLLKVTGDAAPSFKRVEGFESSPQDIASGRAERFLAGCGVGPEDRKEALASARDAARGKVTALLRVELGEPQPVVSVSGGNVVGIAGVPHLVGGAPRADTRLHSIEGGAEPDVGSGRAPSA